MRIRYFTILISTLLFMACDKDVELPLPNDNNISLMADIASMNVSRAAEEYVYIGTSAKDMKAAVWFSTTCGSYANNDNPEAPTYLPYRATVTYGDSPTTVYVDPNAMNRALSYPINETNNDVYCVGLYPSQGWTPNNDNATSVTYNIDGKTDIMFAEQMMGSWQVPFSRQTYRHLLTWLKIEASVTDSEAIEQWGDLKSIIVINPNKTVQITFPTTDNGASTITHINGENEISAMSTPLPLTVTAQNVGSLLCAPATTVKLKITTSKYEKEVSVDLYNRLGTKITDPKETIGQLFIINLYFKSFEDIDATCSLVPWNEQNVDL